MYGYHDFMHKHKIVIGNELVLDHSMKVAELKWTRVNSKGLQCKLLFVDEDAYQETKVSMKKYLCAYSKMLSSISWWSRWASIDI
jgi:hypothetical protein